MTEWVSAHGMSEADKQAMLGGGYLQYMWLGATHMLTGYDHLLFVFGIVFFLTTFMDVVKYITAFTVGHSITLISATLMGITANYWLVDAVIALSVCYIGYENLGGFKKFFEKAPNLLLMIFLLGFIHGFGLSTRLQQLPLGDDGIVLRILSFNLGIELGQISALCVMVALLFKWRRTKSFLQISSVSNKGLIVAGSLLFLMQMHGYLHSVNPDEFGFPEDNHSHAHEAMDALTPVPDNEFDISPLGGVRRNSLE
ncbi:MAG: HupE/UreJ family protein [Nitrospinae bacterium]|nr:HupE/UreJ family protein [Nitrospinota bacterium]MDA1108748.1 HupE/UreJ family protein [Nitrospinota bacterium]